MERSGNLGVDSEPVSILVENCRVRENRHGALFIKGTNVHGRIEFQGNVLSGKRLIRKLPALDVAMPE